MIWWHITIFLYLTRTFRRDMCVWKQQRLASNTFRWWEQIPQKFVQLCKLEQLLVRIILLHVFTCGFRVYNFLHFNFCLIFHLFGALRCVSLVFLFKIFEHTACLVNDTLDDTKSNASFFLIKPAFTYSEHFHFLGTFYFSLLQTPFDSSLWMKNSSERIGNNKSRRNQMLSIRVGWNRKNTTKNNHEFLPHREKEDGEHIDKWGGCIITREYAIYQKFRSHYLKSAHFFELSAADGKIYRTSPEHIIVIDWYKSF